MSDKHLEDHPEKKKPPTTEKDPTTPPIMSNAPNVAEVLTHYEEKPVDHLFLSEVNLSEEGKEIVLQAVIRSVRHQGGIAFLELSGSRADDQLQVVVTLPKDKEGRARFPALDLKKGTVIQVTGTLAARPASAVKQATSPNRFFRHEFHTTIEGINPVVRPEKLDSALPWKGLVDSGLLTQEFYGEIIRMPEFLRVQALREELKETFLDYFKNRGFTEFSVPTLTGSVAESGAEVFKVKGRGRELALNQSPQQIKQIMAALHEKVIAIGQFFRDDPSFTAHHLAEFTGLDMEMQLNYRDKRQAMGQVMNELEGVVRAWVITMANHTQAFTDNDAKIPSVPDTKFPTIGYEDAMAIVKAEDPSLADFNRTAEGILAKKIKETTGSDFYFVTGFPAVEKPFYTDIMEDTPEYTYSFDLIYRGVEIASGGLRINDAKFLRQRLKDKGFKDFEQFETYFDVFERGSAQTGGFGVGLERLVANSLGGINVRLATLYPKTARVSLG